MRRTVLEVKSGGKVVGKTEVDLFDSLEEASSTLGSARCVELINRQVKIEASNKVRDAARRPMTWEKAKQEAARILVSTMSSAELSAAAQSPEAWIKLVEGKAKELMAEKGVPVETA